MKAKSISFSKPNKNSEDKERKKDGKSSPSKPSRAKTPLKRKVFISSNKINSNSSNKKAKKSKRNRYGRILFASLFVVTVVTALISYAIFYYIYSPLNNINASVNRIEENGSLLIEDFSNKDLSGIDEYVSNISTEIEAIDSEIARYEILKDFDSTKGYYENMIIAQSLLDKTESLINKTLPDLKNVLENSGFTVAKGQPVNADQEESTALNLVVQELSLYLDLYEDIEPDIYDMFDDIQALDPNYLPAYESFQPDEDFDKVLDFIDEYPEISEKSKNFFENVPDLIGANEPTDYLIILQNEAEMRGSGGLLTAYGSATIDNGEFDEDINLSDMWNLENYVRYDLGINVGPDNFYQLTSYPSYVSPWGYYVNIYGQNYLMNTGCGATSMRAQDSGLYPDLTWTMNILSDYYDTANLYNQFDYPGYDHMMIFNHKFAKNLISLVEPIQSEEYGDITSENLFDVIKFETDDTSRQFDPNRKEIIAEIANITKEKFLNLPLSEIPTVAETVIKSFQAKDIAVGSKDELIQQYLDDYGLSGKIETSFEGDYFHLNEAQNCSLKLNRWVRNSVNHDVYIGEDGGVKKDVVVNWTQPKIFEDAISKQYWPTLQYRYRAWVRVFMPDGSTNLTSDGLSRSYPFTYYPLDYYDETMQKYVSDNVISFDHRRFVESDPINKQDLIVNYQLPDSINYNNDGEYRVLIQKHPGKSWEDGAFEEHKFNIFHDDEVHIVTFELDRDKVLTYKDGIISVENYDTNLDWMIGLLDGLPFDELEN